MERRSVRRRRSAPSEAVRLARWLAKRPCNRSGADKTWVVDLLEDLRDLVQNARRVV